MHGTTVAGSPKDGPARKAFFSGASGVAYCVAGCRLTLDDIEHGILRCNTPPPGAEAPPFGEGDARLALCLAPPTDPRLHFALNCGAAASKRTPPLGSARPRFEWFGTRGRGRAARHPATASGARAIRLQSR